MEDTPSGVSTAPPPFGPCWKVRDPLPFLPPSILPPSLFLFSPLSLSLSSLSLSLSLSPSFLSPTRPLFPIPLPPLLLLFLFPPPFHLPPFTSSLSPPPPRTKQFRPSAGNWHNPVGDSLLKKTPTKSEKRHQKSQQIHQSHFGFWIDWFFFFFNKNEKKKPNKTKQKQHQQN